ncbi:MAG: lamin tail domain-containing protein [Caldilineaceae bacterium]
MKVVLWLLFWPILLPFSLLRSLFRSQQKRHTSQSRQRKEYQLIQTRSTPQTLWFSRLRTGCGAGLGLIMLLFLCGGLANLVVPVDSQRTTQSSTALPPSTESAAIAVAQLVAPQIEAAVTQPSILASTATATPLPSTLAVDVAPQLAQLSDGAATAFTTPTHTSTSLPTTPPTDTATPLPAATSTPLPTLTATSTATTSPTPQPTYTATAPPTSTFPPIPAANRNANLRGGPGTDYAIVGNVQDGQPLVISARTGSGDWYQLDSGAWIAAFLVDHAPIVEVAQSIPLLPTPTSAPTNPSPPVTQPPAPPPAALAENAGTARIIIEGVYYDGQVPRVESDEYAIIANVGDASANLGGWLLNAGDRGQDFIFPGIELAPGQRVRVYTNEYHPESGGFSFGSGKAIWNNKGDCGILLDSSRVEMSSYCY